MDKHYLFILLYLCRFQAIYSNLNECVDVLLRSGARVDHKAAYVLNNWDRSEEIKGNYQGDDITVGYNATYLKDVLSHINSNEVVVQLKSPISAALFLPKEQEKNSNLTMLLMPIRLND